MKSFYKGKNVLVTGGAGFIGSHIVEKLVALGANITVLDNLSSGNIKNIEKTLPQIKFINDDICSKKACIQSSENVEIIFHLAALSSVQQSIQNPKRCYDINVDGTLNLLKSASKNGTKNFVFSSSAAIYGNRNNTCKETDVPDPQSPYAKSKLEGEKLCKEFETKFKLNTVALRYFNVFGDRQNPNGDYAAVVAKFTNCFQKQSPLTIFGNGKQTRDFIHVSEVSNINLKFGTLPSLNGESFNVASGKSINLFALINKLKKEHKTLPTSITFKPARKCEIFHSRADTTKYQHFISKVDSFAV